MTTSLTSFAPIPRRRSPGARRALHFGMACGTLATLFLTATPPAAVAQEPNRVFADCVLNSNGQGSQSIDTLAGLEGDILATNTNNPNDTDLASATIAYVVVYAINNDNNGQEIEDGGVPTGQFTGPVICVHPDLNIDSVLQTDDIAEIDILDVQDALILRHTSAGSDPLADGANRICHTTDGNTDCFDIFD